MQPDIITPGTQSNNQPPTPPDGEELSPSTPPLSTEPQPEKPKKQGGKKKWKVLGVSAFVLIALIIGFYYLIYLPNTPQNILKKSVENALKMDKISGSGTLGFKQNNSDSGFSLAYALQTDTTKNAASVKAEAAVGEIKIPFEARTVENSAYLKLDDLSGVATLATGFLGPESGAAIGKLGKQISGQWIEFDQSVTQGSGADTCTAGLTSQLSDEDIKQIIDLYNQNMFIDIKSTASDTIDGRSVTKAELGINQEKAKAFGASTQQLDIVKKLTSCSSTASGVGSDQASSLESSDAKLTVWVDKSKKEIVKIGLEGSDSDNTTTLDFTFNSDPVDIQKPEGAIPATQLLGQVLPLLGLGSATGETAAPTPAVLQSQLP